MNYPKIVRQSYKRDLFKAIKRNLGRFCYATASLVFSHNILRFGVICVIMCEVYLFVASDDVRLEWILQK